MGNFQKIELKTNDNKKIIGNFYPLHNNADAPAALLLHMMPATKDSWHDFALKLNQAGFQALAIDLRGHGDSEAGPKGYKNFDDSQHQASINDVEAGARFFLDKGLVMEKISLIGASIGANLALQFQSGNSQIKATVLLSPGLNYKGVETKPAARNLSSGQKIFLAAGGENDEYSAETARKIHGIIGEPNSEIKIFQNAGHGTEMFHSEPALMNDIINWLKNIYQR